MATAIPWIMSNDRPYTEFPIVFGSQETGYYFVDKSIITKHLDVISLCIHGVWPEPDENGNRLFNITIQEEYDTFHGVCHSEILLDRNYKFISETLHDKYDDGFNVGWRECYTMIRYLAGCVDWNDPLAAGITSSVDQISSDDTTAIE
jgi:hypothetical protein